VSVQATPRGVAAGGGLDEDEGVAADHQQLGSIDLGCRLAAYWVGGIGSGQRCCWPLNADPLGGLVVCIIAPITAALVYAVIFALTYSLASRRQGRLTQLCAIAVLGGSFVACLAAVLAVVSTASLVGFLFLVVAHLGLNWELMLEIRRGRRDIAPLAFFSVSRRRCAASIAMWIFFVCLLAPLATYDYLADDVPIAAGIATIALGGVLGTWLAGRALTRFGGIPAAEVRRMITS